MAERSVRTTHGALHRSSIAPLVGVTIHSSYVAF